MSQDQVAYGRSERCARTFQQLDSHRRQPTPMGPGGRKPVRHPQRALMTCRAPGGPARINQLQTQEIPVARAAKPKRKIWTSGDVKVLRQRAKAKIPTRKIAKELKRTLGAVYQRAAIEGITLGGG